MKGKSKQAEVLAKTQLSPSSKIFPERLLIGNKNIHRNIESKKRTILYSIKQGDNLYKISELFDVTIKSIEEINDFSDDSLMPGQIIKIAIRAF